MRTKVTVVLTLFTFILLIPASSADNRTQHSSTVSPFPSTATPFPNVTASTTTPDPKFTSTSGPNHSTGTTEKKLTQRQDTTPTSPSSSSSSSTAVPVSTNTTKGTDPPSFSKSSKFVILLTLLAIIGLMLCVGCVHGMRAQESGQDSALRRRLLAMRDRLRDAIRNLEDLMGLRLWPGEKRGEEDSEEEGAEERRGDGRDDGGEGSGVKNEEEKEEDSDDSNDCSSVEEDNLRERVLGGREEEDSETVRIEDGEETSSVYAGSQSAEEGQTGADKQGGSEEIALVNSVQDDGKQADLCVVTVL